MKIKREILIALVLLAPALTFGQFDLSGEVRPRTEYGHGYKSLADSAQKIGVFTGQRTRLNFDYKNEVIK